MKQKKKKRNVENIQKKREMKKQENQIKWAVIFMIILVIAFIGSYFGARYYMKQSRTFEYKGLVVEKDKQGYVVSVPVKDIYNKLLDTYKFRFRADPRVLENIIAPEIVLTKGTYIDSETFTINGKECEDGTLAGATLITYLAKVGITPIQATITKDIAEQLNITQVDCENSNLSIIVLENRDSNEIKKQGSCYIIQSENCKIMDVAEKFIFDFFAELED